jgi:hypothetical protein
VVHPTRSSLTQSPRYPRKATAAGAVGDHGCPCPKRNVEVNRQNNTPLSKIFTELRGQSGRSVQGQTAELILMHPIDSHRSSWASQPPTCRNTCPHSTLPPVRMPSQPLSGGGSCEKRFEPESSPASSKGVACWCESFSPYQFHDLQRRAELCRVPQPMRMQS